MQKVFSIVRLLLGYLCNPDRTTYFTIAPSRFGPMTRQCADDGAMTMKRWCDTAMVMVQECDDAMVRHSDGDGAGVR